MQIFRIFVLLGFLVIFVCMCGLRYLGNLHFLHYYRYLATCFLGCPCPVSEMRETFRFPGRGGKGEGKMRGELSIERQLCTDQPWKYGAPATQNAESGVLTCWQSANAHLHLFGSWRRHCTFKVWRHPYKAASKCDPTQQASKVFSSI